MILITSRPLTGVNEIMACDDEAPLIEQNTTGGKKTGVGIQPNCKESGVRLKIACCDDNRDTNRRHKR